MALLWACAVTVHGLELRDTAPSMGWAYQLEALDDGVGITIRDPGLVIEAGDGGSMIRVNGPVAWPDPGQPRLPVLALLFESVNEHVYDLDWQAAATEDLPLPRLARVAVPGAQTGRNEDAVTEDAYWPPSPVRISSARGAGRQFIRVEIYPFQYHPAQGILRVHHGMKVRLKYEVLAKPRNTVLSP